jgi:hypothetical protein
MPDHLSFVILNLFQDPLFNKQGAACGSVDAQINSA